MGRTVLALAGRAHFSAEVVGEELQAVADAEDRQAHGEQGGVRDRGVRVVDRTGAAGKNQPDGMMGADLCADAVQGRTTEKTLCSRMRRAMSWVYWLPKSRMTIEEVSTH